MAIGAVSENVGFNSNAQNESLSKDLYHRAWIMFEDAIARPYTSSVQVLILHVIFLSNGRNDLLSMYAGDISISLQQKRHRLGSVRTSCAHGSVSGFAQSRSG